MLGALVLANIVSKTCSRYLVYSNHLWASTTSQPCV
jgi:hypothetical protein